jgi:hypothetical protein
VPSANARLAFRLLYAGRLFCTRDFGPNNDVQRTENAILDDVISVQHFEIHFAVLACTALRDPFRDVGFAALRCPLVK